MIGLLGKKLGMTSVFSDDGERIPVTVLSVGPCKIVQVKTPQTDGYCAVQLGYEPTKPHRVSRPMQGHFQKAGVEPFKRLKEFKLEKTSEEFQVGQSLSVNDVFKEGDLVDCTGVSKGKGFQGVVKRHGFRGGPKSHGQSNKFRSAGSIGASSSPSRVIKGLKMSGQMGNRTVTIRGLRIVKILPEDNLILVKGSVAGSKGSYVIVRKSKKNK
ncbi:50S ribosomal protein L3 [bacterium]|nr:MAG: 50S ribosomal protein L3 [bacterium]